MKISLVGLGKMGAGIATRLLSDESGNHSIVAFDTNPEAANELNESDAFTYVSALEEVVQKLDEPEVVWLMVPAGAPVDSCIDTLLPKLKKGDIIVDGGNSNFHDSKRRYELCAKSGVSFVDVGTSGGVWGAAQGFCMMVGGDKSSFDYLEPALASLTAPGGYAFMGDAGSGHYVKMVHNAVEYALMQSYGEGMDLLARGPYDLSLKDIVSVWNRGGVVRSWLLELGEGMLCNDPNLDSISGHIHDSGTGRWSIEEALEHEVSVPLLSTALFNRFRSRHDNSISDRFIAGLRRAFGGHSVKSSK